MEKSAGFLHLFMARSMLLNVTRMIDNADIVLLCLFHDTLRSRNVIAVLLYTFYIR